MGILDNMKSDVLKLNSMASLAPIKGGDLKYNDIAKPYSEHNGYYYYRDKNTRETYKVDSSTLNGSGILPDGRIIISDREEDPEYRYTIIKLKKDYHSMQNSKDKNLDEDTRKFVLDDIYNKAYNAIRAKYPDLTEEQIKDKTDNDWLNSPNDYYTINDATDRLNEFMDSYVNSDYWKLMRGTNLLGEPNYTLGLFFFEVKKNAPLDLKNQEKWQNSLFIYNSEIVDRDALANIAYGYFGSFLNIHEYTLHWGASMAQNEDNNTNTGDDPRDAARIQQGIDLFKSHLEREQMSNYTKDDYSHIYKNNYTGNSNIDGLKVIIKILKSIFK